MESRATTGVVVDHFRERGPPGSNVYWHRHFVASTPQYSLSVVGLESIVWMCFVTQKASCGFMFFFVQFHS